MRLLLPLLVLCLLAGVARSADVSSTWLGGGGSWTDGSKWSSAPAFPENGAKTYDATITGDGVNFDEILLDRDLAIDALFLQYTSLRVDGTLTLEQGLHGTSFNILSGTGSIVSRGTNSGFGDISLQGPSLVNEGVATWSQGGLNVSGGSSVRNAAGATLAFANDGDLGVFNFGGGTFSNEGLLEKNGSGVATIELPFSNSGSVVVHSGLLNLTGSDTSSSSGSFQIDSGASLFSVGSLLPTATVSGGGSVALWNGTVQGTLDLDGALSVRGIRLESNGNRVGSLEITNSYGPGLDLAGDLVVDGDLYWRGGILTGAGALEVHGTNRLIGPGMVLDGRTLSSETAMAWSDSDLTLQNGARVINELDSQAEISGGNAILSDGTGELINHGLMTQNDGTFLTGVPFSNDGIVNVAGGQFGTLGTTSSGTIHVGAGASFRVGGSSSLTDTSVVDGPGDFVFTGGETTVLGSFEPGRTVVDGGVVHLFQPSFSTALELDSGEVSFADPIHLGVAPLVLAGGRLTLQNGSRISGDRDWNATLGGSGTIDLEGEVNFLAGGFDGVTVKNAGHFTEGAYRTLALDNGAVLENLEGAELRFGGYIGLFGGTLINEGTLIAEPGSPGVGTLRNSSQFEVNGAYVSLGDYQQTAGKLLLRDGAMIQTGATFDIQGGSLAGTGGISGSVTDHGTLAPGDAGAAGALSIDQLTLFDSSHLDFELGGKLRGVSFDSLDVSQIFLDGELSLRFIDGFETTIAPEDQFELVHSFLAIQGVLDNVADGARLATVDGLGSFAVHYSGKSLVIDDFHPVPEPGSLALLLLGLTGAFALRRDRRQPQGELAPVAAFGQGKGQSTADRASRRA